MCDLMVKVPIPASHLGSTGATVNPVIIDIAKKGVVRKRVRELRSKLWFQTACPMLFMYAPIGFMYVMLFSGTRSTTAMTATIAALFSMFPLIDPIIPIVFLREYREFVLDGLNNISPTRVASLPTLRTIFS
ncbi:hypothetical protein COOONC_02776 [Cooperia oncophora]